jgi:hemerythrin
MITWTEQFQTGSVALDQQHRLLIDNINLLGEQLRNPDRTTEELEFAIHLVEYLEAYANIHFKAEEKCMESYRCPVHTKNLQEHERFREFIRAYKSRCEAEGFRVELLNNLHRAIRTWIEEHILKIDTQLRPCIALSAPKSSGAAPES